MRTSAGSDERGRSDNGLVLIVVAAALAGILAAILSGRRAARVDMLWAISTA
jgi:hypothetical protein